MVKGAAGRRLPAPGALHLDRRIGRTLALYLVVITVIVGYNARAIADQRGSALRVNVLAVQGADEEIQIHPASHDPLVVAKLEEENRLIQELIAVGDDVYTMRAGQPGYQEA